MSGSAWPDSRRNRAPWLGALAWLMLIAGLAIGGLALASAAGVWLGLWDFRRGFRLLAVANSWGDVTAIVGVVVTIGVVVLAMALRTGNAVRLGALALVGTVAAYLGYAIPESYRPSPDIPPIHDISTDQEDPPEFVA
ncbi:MAG TPA: hypothetical protein VIN61_18765, partial [Gammaproteobacteria bacterium]